MAYFKELMTLLHIEREQDKALYQDLIKSTTVNHRRAAGLTWYPIAIKDSELGRGDYLTVEVERTTHQDVPHQLRFGASAALFSNHNAKEHRVEGVISHQSGNRLKITLRTDELPDWSRDGKLGIDLMFDDNSYDEMEAALKQAALINDKGKDNHLIKILTGEKKPGFEPLPNDQPQLPALNESQRAAIQKILSANELTIVHGPPGTGKTTTLVQGIKALLHRGEKRILVVAPSNTAVDLLTEKIADEGIFVIRVGNPARVSEKLMSLTLDSKMSEHSSMKDIKKMKKQANEYRNMAHKYKRNFGKAEREQRKALFDEAHKIIKEIEKTEQYIADDLLGRAQVITATLVGSNHYTVKNLQYHTVIIDEAGQALEPACWIPILKAKKVVLAGDHCQLPPTIKSQEAAAKGLATTLLEKCVQHHPEAVALLEEQYRMHEVIMGYSSDVFYENKLRAHASVAKHALLNEEIPLHFVDTAGCGFDEQVEDSSTFNPEEAAFVFRHLSHLVENLSQHYTRDNFPSIGIISPYRRQILQLQELMLSQTNLKPYAHKITVNTIDSFQGQERDIVYISMTRSNADNNIGFLSDIRRMNVAMTRARKKLVVIGDSATLSQFPFYENFIQYAQHRNAYVSAWEFMDM